MALTPHFSDISSTSTVCRRIVILPNGSVAPVMILRAMPLLHW